MTYRYIGTALCIGLLCLVSFPSAGSEEAPESIGEFVLQMPALASRPLVNYCAAEHPELRDDLDGEYESFLRKLLEAARPFTEGLSSEQGFAAPVPPGMRAQVKKIGEAMLARVKNGDSGTQCKMILARMRNSTVEQLAAQIMQAYGSYRERTLDGGAGESGAR